LIKELKVGDSGLYIRGNNISIVDLKQKGKTRDSNLTLNISIASAFHFTPLLKQGPEASLHPGGQSVALYLNTFNILFYFYFYYQNIGLRFDLLGVDLLPALDLIILFFIFYFLSFIFYLLFLGGIP
jgi:hypothetical protein